MSRNTVKRAVDTLEREGRSHRTVETSKGRAIGSAIYDMLEPAECVELAMEVLEQWNGHLSVAAIAAIEKHRGKVTRKGRKLTIELPEHWQNL